MTRGYPEIAEHLPVEISGVEVDGSVLTIWGTGWTLTVSVRGKARSTGEPSTPTTTISSNSSAHSSGKRCSASARSTSMTPDSSSATASSSSRLTLTTHPGASDSPTTSSMRSEPIRRKKAEVRTLAWVISDENLRLAGARMYGMQ